MGLSIAPREVRPFQIHILVLQLFLVVPELCGLVEGTLDISPPDRGWGVVALVTYVFLFSD
jgi:hypothetical protein